MSVPVEAKLLRRALDGALPRLLDVGFQPNRLRPPYDEAFTKIVDHYTKYYQLPSPAAAKEILDDLLAKGLIVSPAKECPDSAEYYWDVVLEEGLDGELVTGFEDISREHVARKIYGRTLLDKVLALAQTLYDKFSSKGSASQTSEGAGRELRKEYADNKAGTITGIPIDPNFPNLTESLISLRPAHITTIIARSKVGKTWLALMLCLHAAKNGTRVLIASMEMIRVDLVRRLAALEGKVNYDGALKGKLLPEQEERYHKILDDADNKRGFWANFRFMNPAEITDLLAVERQAVNFDAQLVLADAFYDFPAPVEFEKDWERIRYNLRVVRAVSLSTKRHWILTAQFTKQAKKFATSDDFAVGGTDAFNYVSNSTIYMIQGPRDRELGFVFIKVGRAREAPASRPWKHRWDFKEMDLRPIAMQLPTSRVGPKALGPQI